jgi:hypothetical protein
MCTKDRWASILMTSGFVLSLCKTISVFCNCFVLLLYFFSQAGYTLNAPASRRIIGYQFTNPHSGKGFTNVFAYEQHRNDAVRAGNLCASLTMRDELTGVRRVDRPVPVLHARPLPGLDGVNNAKRMWMRMLLCQRTERWACCSLNEFRPCSKFC